MSEKFGVDMHGDIISVYWDGNTWVAPSCGAQFARAREALAVEVQLYLQSCGENTTYEEALALAKREGRFLEEADEEEDEGEDDY